MDYIKIALTFSAIEEYQHDLLIAELAEIGFNTFEDTALGFDAFILANDYDEKAFNTVLLGFAEELSYSFELTRIESENWNEEWEKNFSPLVITDECYVRATFHEPQPQYKYQIVIDPKMAFGTGHHQTTALMMEYILAAPLQDTVVLDMGAGTGILGILASKLGAKQIIAIDNDEVCYRSAIENAALNEVVNLVSYCGSKETIPAQDFDIIFANINRNILLDQIESYAYVLKNSGSIYFSGFYEKPDLEMIKTHAQLFGLTYVNHKKNGEWVAAHFLKI